MKSAPKNLAASVKARLLHVAAQRSEDFNLLLLRYGIERLLCRLSQSAHANRFLVKGAMLFVVWDEKTHRPTRDLDLLGFGPSEAAYLERLFRDVVTTPIVADGLVYEAESVRAEAIREDTTYGGVRVRLQAKLGPAQVPVQIDVGAGDAVTPGPVPVSFPTLLDFPAPQVRTYPVYTVVAEKFEAMVKLGIANTRMKDFHDVWFLARRFEFDRSVLRQAMEATFAWRKTDFPIWLEPLSDTFASDPAKQMPWAAFLRRNALSGVSPQFVEIVADLREFLGPVIASRAP